MYTFVTSLNANSAVYTNLIKQETNHSSHDHACIYTAVEGFSWIVNEVSIL
jgi:hypothetical protein